MNNTICRYKLIDIIKFEKLFKCVFIKKNGDTRTMICSYVDSKFNSTLVTVYDIENEGYRNINIETMLNIHIQQKTYRIK